MRRARGKADQLKADNVAKAAVRSKRRVKAPRGYFMVNMAAWEQQVLRNLAKASGMEFRQFVRYALNSYRQETMEALGISFDQACQLGPELTEALRERSRAYYQTRWKGVFSREEFN